MAPSVYDFGPFRVDRVAYRMTRGSETVELSPKLLDLLLYLLERPAALVTKEELLDALWPGANVTENALAQAVSELRQALGDEAGSPTFIKTVARRGYRLIALVRAIDAPAPVADVGPDPVPAAAHTIAVLDFVNVTGETADAWLSHGIAETVTGDLRALGRFRVVDRRRVAEAAAATNGSLQAVTDFIGARLAVVGSFQRTGARIRITARAVDVVSGEAFADAKVDGALDDIFDLQDQVVRSFARELGIATGSSSAPASRDNIEPLTSEIAAYWRLEGFNRFGREVALSTTWALYATALIVVGIRRRYAPIRYLAIAVLGGTILKVLFVDLAALDQIYRVSSAIGLGVLLLVTSYPYTRFRARLAPIE